MNLQDIAKKEAERLYPTIGDINPHLNDVNELSQSLFLHGFTFCLNTLAGSEGDVGKVINALQKRIDKHDFTDISYSQDDSPSTEYFETSSFLEAVKQSMQEHTASAVAKVMGEKWVSVETPPETDDEVIVIIAKGGDVNRNYYYKLMTYSGGKWVYENLKEFDWNNQDYMEIILWQSILLPTPPSK